MFNKFWYFIFYTFVVQNSLMSMHVTCMTIQTKEKRQMNGMLLETLHMRIEDNLGNLYFCKVGTNLLLIKKNILFINTIN